MGLDLAGTYFSGGTLALVGMSQLGAVTAGTVTSAGVVTLTDAISRMGIASSTVSFSFAQNYGQYHKDLTPNNSYTAGEHNYNYNTDDLGRIANAEAKKLKLKTHDGRLPHNLQMSHLIQMASQFLNRSIE